MSSRIKARSALYLALKDAGHEATVAQVDRVLAALNRNRWSLRFAACSKVAYPSKAGADQHLRFGVRRGRTDYTGMHAYRCPDCAKWHLGHSRTAA